LESVDDASASVVDLDFTVCYHGADAVVDSDHYTSTDGSASRQEFPVDQFSIDLFLREGSAASVTNVWAMEIVPGQQFVYELSRPGSDRMFRVAFDLSTPVATPPSPWGHPELN
jgi:hypothetical protein